MQRYYYKDHDKHTDALKLHYTQAPFIGWTRGGLLNAWYACFQRKSETMLVPRYLLTKETKELLPALPKEN